MQGCNQEELNGMRINKYCLSCVDVLDIFKINNLKY